jgi:pimeloyl-ACP methyl ester carboxylesterase
MVRLSEQGFRCIAYDARGHGRSSDPGQGYDFDTLADDLASVIDQLDLHDVVLVGHSMGAAEVVRYLVRHGLSRVAKIVLVAPTLPFLLKTADNPEGLDAEVFEEVRASIRRDFPKWLAENAPPFFAPDTSQQMVQWGIGMCLQSSFKAVMETNRADTGTDFRKDLSRITVPTLVIHGDRDVSAPLDSTGRRTANLIRGSELKVYEGGPHGLFITHMDQLTGDLATFARVNALAGRYASTHR